MIGNQGKRRSTMARHERLDVNEFHVKTILMDNFDGTAAASLSGTEIQYLDGLTIGTVTASKAVVVDANKDASAFRNVGVVNLDAGSDAVAGSVDIFPTTTASGKMILACADNGGAFDVTITNASHGQSTAVTIPDSGLATSYVAQSTAALTVAEVDVLDGAVAANSVASKVALLDGGKAIQTAANIGAVETGVTATEYGDGYMHNTRLAVSITDAFSTADNAALATGVLLYTLPAGQIIIHSASLVDLAITGASAEQQTDTPDVGLGTVVGSTAVATLDLAPAGAENILTGQTWSTGTLNGTAQSAVAGLATPLAIADGDAHTVYLNVADTWADDTGGDLTCDVTAVIHLVWSYMGNPA
jgi:hypothetical protein